MMVIKVKVLVPSRKLFGVEEHIEGSSNVRSILVRLASKYGAEFVKKVYDPVEDKLRPWIVILKNGRNIDFTVENLQS